MRVVVCGSRDGFSYADTENYLNRIAKTGVVFSEIICGDARGVDTHGRLYGEKYGIPVRRMPADWATHGKRAGYMRNLDMLAVADMVVALIYCNSKGTSHTVKNATQMKMPCYILNRNLK